jgi:hypothetical protein
MRLWSGLIDFSSNSIDLLNLFIGLFQNKVIMHLNMEESKLIRVKMIGTNNKTNTNNPSIVQPY